MPLPKCFRNVDRFKLLEGGSKYAIVALDDGKKVILKKMSTTFFDVEQTDVRVNGIFCDLQNMACRRYVTFKGKEPAYLNRLYSEWAEKPVVVSLEAFDNDYEIDKSRYETPLELHNIADQIYFDKTGTMLAEWPEDSSVVVYCLDMSDTDTTLYIKEGF